MYYKCNIPKNCNTCNIYVGRWGRHIWKTFLNRPRMNHKRTDFESTPIRRQIQPDEIYPKSISFE